MLVIAVVGCPADEELVALLSGELDGARRAESFDHVAGCARCRGVIAGLTATSNTLSLGTSAETRTFASPSEDARLAAPLGALFARDQKTKIGRYLLLEIVGAGGMGVVWGAWDPELARRVALKLVHPQLAPARDRVLAEGQALAKLSHPNVVPIYDVGMIDGQVYLVMEWVQGTTLRAYASAGASQRELLEAYRQAGEGLAAAHRAGLTHRDFKPDNAIRGDDGRVRVLDFGIARGNDDEPIDPGGEHARAGTRRYMAPEQAIGGAITPAADQYAFAISLREALTRPVADRIPELPGWITQIIARASAVAPGARFASMEQLVHALGRDPARIWRRRAVALAAVAAAAVAFVVGRVHTSAPPPPSCTGSRDEIATTWNPATRTALIGHLQRLGAFGAGEAGRLGDELDAYSAAWAAEHHRACIAHDHGELPTALYERRIGCLARGKAALTTVAELMTSVSADALAPALIAARALPSAAGCAAGDASVVPPPPIAVAAQVAAVEPAVERARVLAVAGRADAVTVARAGVAAAERTAYAPLIARALVAQGRAEMELNAGELPPRTSFERAVDLALRSSDDVLAVEAYARLIWAVARYHGDVVDNWSVMEAIAARTGSAGRFAVALLYNNKAIARNASNDRAGARGLLQKAIAAASADLRPDDSVELANVAQNMALYADDPAERETRSTQGVSRLEAILGPQHPLTLQARFLAGTLTRDPVKAAAQFATACDGYQRWHPQLTVKLTDCAFERAWLADDRGDVPGAVAAMTIAAMDPLSPRDRQKGSIAASYVKIARDEQTAAAAVAMQALGARLSSTSEFWTRSAGADAYATAAVGWDRLGQRASADQCWAAAVSLLEPLTQPLYERRLAHARAALARHWKLTRPTDARRLAAAAVAWYRAAGGYQTEVAELASIAAAG